MWTTLILRVCRKQKMWARDICKRTQYMEFERDRWIGLGPALGDEKFWIYIFSVSWILSGKADSVIFLGFECTINPQNLIKVVGAIFEKIRILNFFLKWITLNFRGRGKTKKNGSRYLHEDPIYRIWTRSVNWFRLYVRRQSHRQTHTHTQTFFLKHIFRLWEWCRTKNHKK